MQQIFEILGRDIRVIWSAYGQHYHWGVVGSAMRKDMTEEKFPGKTEKGRKVSGKLGDVSAGFSSLEQNTRHL